MPSVSIRIVVTALLTPICTKIFATLVVTTLAANSTTTKATTKATTKTTTTKLLPASKTKTGKTGKPGKFRERRTLYNFGNFGYNPRQIPRNNQVNRRIATYNDFYQQDPYSGQFSGPSNNYIPEANNHLIDQSPAYYQQPQYLEAPEPIIEIIIKESNETLPEPPPQPHFIKKKKKEQVQVFYVNYRKGHDNKLQLENPIPALTPIGYSQDEHEEEEIQEVIHPVTPLPPVKTTTLRTIIHPDSEKFHSNSGVHVSFNIEDKYQSGHQLQEHNEGSEIQSVVALPNPQGSPSPEPHANHLQNHHLNHQLNHQPDHRPDYQPNHQSNHLANHQLIHSPNYQTASPRPTPRPSSQFNHRYYSHFRSDYSRAQHNLNSNYRNDHIQQPPPTHLQPYVNQFQTPPQSQQSAFRGFVQPQQPPPPSNYRQNSFHGQPQITHLSPMNPPFQSHPVQPQFQLPQSQHSTPQFNRQPPPPPPPQLPIKQFPLPDDKFKTQIKSHVNYQPLKYRQQLSVSPHKPIPIPLHSIQPDGPPPPLNRPVSFGPPTAPAAQFNQPQPEPVPHFRPKPNPFPNHQQQPIESPVQQHFQQNKFFPPAVPTAPENHADFNRYQQQQHQQQYQQYQEKQQQQYQEKQQQQYQEKQQQQYQEKQQQQYQEKQQQQYQEKQQQQYQEKQQQQYQEKQHQQNQHQQHQHHQHQYQHQQHQQQNHQQFHNDENPLNNINVPFLGNVKSELIKSVPKFEQHITETISETANHFGPSGQQSQIYNEFATNTQNNAIQTVPSPNLGPTTPPSEEPEQHQQQHQQQHQSSTPQGHFSSTFSQHLSSVASHQDHYGGLEQQYSSTPTPTEYSEHQQEQLQIVTPVPSHYNHHPTSFSGFNQNNVRLQIIPNSQPVHQKLPAPGKSVSTIHTEALKELEELKNSYFAQDQTSNNRYVEIAGRNPFVQHQSTTPFSRHHRYHQSSSTTPSTTFVPTTTPTTTEVPSTTTAKPQVNLHLPDEVPDDLRQQLISSGILANADISVLDYDKIGDTALENLPPEHLANFYGAGGATQISGSSKVISVVKPNGEGVSLNERQIEKFKQSQKLPRRENVDLKVVRFDSASQKSVTDRYIRPDATILPAVDINNPTFNRYLPLKINGAQFPLPDAQELRGKRISSVVVLAPVDPLQHNVEEHSYDSAESRQERGLAESKRVRFIAGDTLKTLLKKPTRENFKRWLEKESKTDIDFQSVVLLVTKNIYNEQEIYMYDIATKETNKLSGALSSAFVNVAEENASSQDIDNASISDSGIVEKMTPEPKDYMFAEASNRKETVVKYSSKIQSRRDDESKPVYINSGYSVIRK